jgi:hypothetical protein
MSGLTNRIGFRFKNERERDLMDRFLTHVINNATDDEPPGSFTKAEWRMILRAVVRLKIATEKY